MQINPVFKGVTKCFENSTFIKPLLHEFLD